MTSNVNLRHVATTRGLFRCLNMHPSNPLQESEVLMATLVEAMFGAVYLDSGNNLHILGQLMQHWGVSYAAGLARVNG